MKKRKTAARWLSDILGNPPHLERMADQADRRIDHRVGRQIREASDKTPQTDWRTLMHTKKTP